MICPVNHYIVVKKIKKETTNSGLVLTTKTDNDVISRGEVVRIDDESEMRFTTLIGDVLVFFNHKAVKVEDTDGEEYYLIKDEDVIAYIEDCEEGEQ